MDTKAANPGCLRGSRRRSRFVITLHRDNVAFAIIGNKFSSDVLSDAADDRALSPTVEPEAGACAKLGDCKCPQFGDVTDEDLLFLLHDVPPLSRKTSELLKFENMGHRPDDPDWMDTNARQGRRAGAGHTT